MVWWWIRNLLRHCEMGWNVRWSSGLSHGSHLPIGAEFERVLPASIEERQRKRWRIGKADLEIPGRREQTKRQSLYRKPLDDARQLGRWRYERGIEDDVGRAAQSKLRFRPVRHRKGTETRVYRKFGKGVGRASNRTLGGLRNGPSASDRKPTRGRETGTQIANWDWGHSRWSWSISTRTGRANCGGKRIAGRGCWKSQESPDSRPLEDDTIEGGSTK